MSLSSVLAYLFGVVVVIGSIVSATEHPEAFIDIPSVIIVFGGTVAALFLSFEPKTAFEAFKLLLSTLRIHKDSNASLKDEVGRIVRWAYIVQKNGLQGLENEVTDDLRQKDPFLAYGADLVVTGYTGAEIKQILENMMDAQLERDSKGSSALMKMGGDSPAFGMLGTLIGLVIMLGNMSSDPSAIGPSMAVALITTFYGIILARIFFIPAATKVIARNSVSMFKYNLQMEGLVLLAERKSPRYIQDKINSFVDVSEQFLIDRDMNNSSN